MFALYEVLAVRRLTCVFHKQGINVHLAKKMIEDRSRDYMNARRVAKVRQSVTNMHKLNPCVVYLKKKKIRLSL